MSLPLLLYDVLVQVRRPKRQNRSGFRSRTYRVEAKDGERARQIVGKHGIVVSVKKVDIGELLARIEHLPLDQAPFSPAIAMDEMVWKRRQRLSNKHKDNQQID